MVAFVNTTTTTISV